MKTEIWLRIGAKKRFVNWEPADVTAFKTKPTTTDRQIAVKVILEIPDAIFDEPAFEATVKLPNVTRKMPKSIVVGEHVQHALNEALGFKVKVEMKEPEPKA